MLKVEIRAIDELTLINYVNEQKLIGYSDIKEVKGTLCLQTISWLLNDSSMQPRKAYGIFYHDTMAGYAIFYPPTALVDFLHIYPLYRGIGLAKILINGLGVKNTIVNIRNIVAIRLYESLGFIKDIDESTETDYVMKRRVG